MQVISSVTGAIMKLQLFANVYLLLCSGFSFFYGIARILSKKKSPTYLSFVTFAMLSAFLSRVFNAVSIAFYKAVPDTFNIGFLGYAATFLFIFFANSKQIDLLVDDKRTLKCRYRIIPVILPALELAISIPMLFFRTVPISVRIACLVISIITGHAGYYNMKHAIIPDVDFGIVRSIRGYNILALLMGILSLAEIRLNIFDHAALVLSVQLLLGITYACIMPVLGREVMKWTQ